MSIATRSNTDSETFITSVGPGRMLKDAREAAGLSLRDVTEKLHLDLKVVTALEEDNFSALPTATFVRGYLRSYTQLLGLPIEPVLEALDNEHLSPPELIADIAEAPQARSDDMPVRLASYGVIAALTIMVVLWWNNQDFDFRELLQPGSGIEIRDNESNTQAPPVTPLISPQQLEEPIAAESDMTPIDTVSNDEITTVVVQNSDTADTVTTPEPAPGSASEALAAADAGATAQDADPLAQQLAEAQQSIEASRQVLAQGPTQVDTPPTTDSEPAEATTAPGQDPITSTAPQPQTTASVTVPETTESTASVTGEDTLSMRFTRESWVTVLDRNEKRLFYNLTGTDQTLELRGPGPLRVLLGRPQGVTVLYNGKLMDLSPYISSSGVARFTGNP